MNTRSPWGVFALTSSAVFLVSLDATVVVAAFPAFAREFVSTAPSRLSWILNVYTILYAALLVPMGRLADRRGRKRVFLRGLALFTLASIACGFAPGPDALIAARAAQALGAAMLTPASLALILETFPRERRSVAISLWGAVGAFAAAIGPAAGSWLIEAFSWRAIFWINAPLGVFACWRGATRLHKSRASGEDGATDWLGATVLIVATGALAWGLVHGGEIGWSAPKTWVALALGVTALVGALAWSRGRAGAVLDLTLFRDRNYGFANLATLVFGAAFSLMFLTFFLFMTRVWGYSQHLAGLAATPGPLMVIPVAIIGGRFAARVGHRRLLIAGGLLYAISQLWFFTRLDLHAAYLTTWLPGQLVSGAAIGLVLPSLVGAAVAGLPPGRFAVGNALNAALRQLGGALGIAVGVGLIGSPEATLEDFRRVYLLLAAGGMLTAALAGMIDTRGAR